MRNPHHIPRAAHCIGCGHTFNKMHLMINHRRLNRCGGRFLPAEERALVDAAKLHYQKWDSTAELMQGMAITHPAYDDLLDQLRWRYAQYRDMTARFYLLRKRRLDSVADAQA